MTQITLARGATETGANEWNDVYSNDLAITTVVNGQLSNDNLDAAAAIAHSKLANGTSGQLLVANSSGVITSTTVTGDVTISSTGVTAIGSDKVTATQLKDSASVDGDRAVTTDHIRDGAVTTAKIDDPSDAVYSASDLGSSSGGVYYDTYSSTADSGPVEVSSVPPGVYLATVRCQGFTGTASGTPTVYFGVKATSGTATYSNAQNVEVLNAGILGNYAYSTLVAPANFVKQVVVTVTATATIRGVMYYSGSISSPVVMAPSLTIFGVKS